MIKFFKNTRYKMIGQSRAGRYLLYAIGEIFLVVIGILIALQINNWNENRKNQKLIAVYKKNLIENLKQDSIVIAHKIKSIKSDILKIEAFEKRVSASQKPLDTILKIARYDYTFNIGISNHYEKNTYEMLNSTGHIALLDNELSKKLKESNSLQDRDLAANDHSFDSYRFNANNYSQKYPFSFGRNLINNKTKAATEVWNNISISDHATAFNALIISKGDAYRLALKYLPDLSTKTNELLKELRKQD